MTIRQRLHLPEAETFTNFAHVTAYVRRLRDGLKSVSRGQMECVGEITLTINSATTVLSRLGLSNQSVVTFDPKTANAATELYGGTMYVLTANRLADSWTITHVNSATADRTFQYSAIG